MKTIAHQAVLTELIRRLDAITPAHERVWGSITAQQMLVHLGDGVDAVLKRHPFAASRKPPSRLLKWIALRSPLRWPRGIKSGAEPGAKLLAPEGFASDRDRARGTLRDLAEAAADAVVAQHPIFGPMTLADWHRWAFLHTDHHLRQFGL
jgi:hypothetical protein